MVNNELKTAVKVSDLSVIYPSGVNALENVSFEVKEGEFLGIIGPNGGGKTTLLKAILNLIPVNSGTVEIYGKPIKEAKSEIGYVPQFSKMNSTFPISVKEVVLSGFLSAGKPIFKYTVNFSDLDHNKHMNNTYYANLVVNAIENKVVNHFEINFVSECLLHDEISVFYNNENEQLVCGTVNNKTVFIAIVK